jgi:hypothetical protein
MRTLPAPELAQTYAWYQLVLNLRMADVYGKHGPPFLPTLKEKLPLCNMDNRTVRWPLLLTAWLC